MVEILAQYIKGNQENMDISKIETGANPPTEINVIIEIVAGSSPVKYELNKESGALFVDRFMQSAMYYPYHYGFIPNTLSKDGDPCDALVIVDVPVVAGCVIRARPIGVIMMKDEAGEDEKILAVPVKHPYYEKVKSYKDLPSIVVDKLVHFFENYKGLEKGKWVKIKGLGDAAKAQQLILQGMKRAK